MSAEGPFAGIDKIIGTVNSPLALAALAVLVVGVVLYATKGSRANAPLVYCGFGLAALFGVLAIAGFIYQGSVTQIDLVRGLVVDQRGVGVEGALVDLLGGASEKPIGRTASMRDGSFVIPVTAPDRRKSYTLEARKAGYQPAVRGDIVGPVPEIGRISLSEMTFKADDFTIGESLVAAMYFGVPELQLDFVADNKTDVSESVKAISLTLTDPAGSRFVVYPANYIDDGRVVTVTQFSFPRLQKTSLRIIWNDMGQINGVTQRMLQTLSTAFMNTCTPGILPPAVADEFGQIFDENFVWKPGNWKGRLTVRTDNVTLNKSFAFNFSEKEVQSMQAMKALYRKCFGVVYGQHWLNHSGARNNVSVEVLSENTP